MGLYYLQSRYYNPTMGRFLNADALISTGQGALGNNMFAYCRNNPVSRKDVTGTVDLQVFLDDGSDGDVDCSPIDPDDVCAGGGNTAQTNSGSNTNAGIAGVLNGYTSHGMHQATTRNGVGVKPSAILDTLRNPIKVENRIDSMGRISVVYTGSSSVVVLNQGGFLITCWAKSRVAWR